MLHKTSGSASKIFIPFAKTIIIADSCTLRIRYPCNSRTIYDGQLERFARKKLYEKDLIIIKEIPGEYHKI